MKRKARKIRAMGPRHPDRNAPFENIARLKQEYLAAGQPVLSIDAKKKELLGNFYRDGKLYTFISARATRPASSPATASGGGGDSASRYVFKEELQKLADRLGLESRVAHYPPYGSKYNPIEHRLFPHVTRACQGVVFHTTGIVRELMEKTKTRTGLAVTVDIKDKVYEVGRKAAKGFKEKMKIAFDSVLPKWNYRVIPAIT